MKKILSIMLALMLVFGMVSFSASALSLGSYTEAEYKPWNVGTTYQDELLADDPYIVSGPSKALAITLEAGKTYLFQGALINTVDAYNYLDIGVLAPNLTGDIDADVVTYGYDSGADQALVNFPFTPEESGTYHVLLMGDCDGNYGTDTALQFLVSEVESVDVVINNEDDLIALDAKAVSGEYIEKRVNVTFAADLDLTDLDWSSATDYDNYYFTLFVEGNGHVIEGVSGPIFGYVYNGVIDDLDIKFYIEDYTGGDFGAYVSVAGENLAFTNCDAQGAIYLCSEVSEDVGAFVGDAYNVTFENCTLSCDIMSDYDANYVGGYVGYSNGIFEMKNCTAEVTIDIRNETEGYHIGGVVGYIEDEGVIENCIVNAEVYASNTNYVGGFAGAIDEVNRFVNVAVEGSVTGAYGVGGFVGDSSCCGYNDFINCYAAVDVEGIGAFGGFAGTAYDSDSFRNCYAAGNVTYIGEDGAYDGSGGAFLGYAYYSNITLENCYGKMQDGFDVYGYVDGDGLVCSAYTMRFDSDAAMDVLEDSLNEYVDESFEKGLLHWRDRNAMNGPMLLFPKAIDSLKIVLEDFEAGNRVINTTVSLADTTLVVYDELFFTDLENVMGSQLSGEIKADTTYYLAVIINDNEEETLSDLTIENVTLEGATVVAGAIEEIEGGTKGTRVIILQLAPLTAAITGDVNGDGEVDMFDYAIVKKVYFELPGFSLETYPLADVDGDGEVTPFDYLIVKKAYFNS